MTRFSALDERFAHQIPEPFPTTSHFHPAWRESLFFIMHPKDRPGDVVILTMAHFPATGVMDSLQMGKIGSENTFAHHARPVNGDQDRLAVGPVSVTMEEPLKRFRLAVADTPATPVALDITFTGRTEPYGLRRGTMSAGSELIWDQSHMFQSGRFDGHFIRNGVRHEVVDWIGQRDRSWGIRQHNRCPCWIWLAIQLPEGMLAVWHWEYANGAPVFSDGCFAPSDGSTPIPVVAFEHALDWLDAKDAPVSYGRYGQAVEGLAGDVAFTLHGGRVITVKAKGRWAQRYSIPTAEDHQPDAPVLGGGLCQMEVETGDGSVGTAIYEITGQWHHRYFPLTRADRLPPYGYSPAAEEVAI